MKTAGYSKTPLARKLGIKEGSTIKLVNQPENYFELFENFPENLIFESRKKIKKDLIHYFTKNSSELMDNIVSLRNEIKENGVIWISWPKKASKVPTDITEDTVRGLALKNGLVDIKVCAVDEIWSGLKLVIPVKDRKASR
uniref:DUF3052 family protein n=1 Tax=Roseivirga sp. TaxID=1964215 RepID=UPI004047BF7C